MNGALILGQVSPNSDVPASGYSAVRIDTSGRPYVILADGTNAYLGAARYQSASPSAAGNTGITMEAPYRRHKSKLTPAAGSGAYTHVWYLPTSGRIAGDEEEILIELPASTNPTIEIRNATSGGTLLHSVTGIASATNYIARCVFTGSAWELFDVRQIV